MEGRTAGLPLHLTLQRGQDPVKWMFHYYVRLVEGSHERIHFENLYGFSMYLLEIMLVSTVKTSIASTAG